jgi:hypothetical protein
VKNSQFLSYSEGTCHTISYFDLPEYCLTDMALLHEHDAYRAYHPKYHVHENHELIREFEAIRKTLEFQSLKGEHTFERKDFRIYFPKLDDIIEMVKLFCTYNIAGALC